MAHKASRLYYWNIAETIPLDTWETPATHYNRGKTGSVEIVSTPYKRGVYDAYMTGPEQEQYQYYRLDKRINVTALEIEGKTWMVDDPPHWWAMQAHATHYHGHVLVAGLGLGLILHAMRNNPKITQITVVERNPDVIKAISPYLPDLPITIIEDDWYKFRTKEKIDGVFYDLFVGKGADLFSEALREIICLAQDYPDTNVFRIHGFGDSLHNFGVATREAQKTLANFHQLTPLEKT